MLRLLCTALIAASLAGVSAKAQTDQPQKGYAAAVIDDATIATVTTRFQKDLTDLGIQATVSSCRLMERVSVGVRDGDNAFGAACNVTIANQKPKTLLLCDDEFGESFAMVKTGFANTPEMMEGFVRRNCF